MRKLWNKITGKTLFEHITEKEFQKIKEEYFLALEGKGPIPKKMTPSLFERFTEKEFQEIKNKVEEDLGRLEQK